MIDWARIHGEKGFRASYLPLSFMSLLYGVGVRLSLKNNKTRDKLSLPGFTVSIGNLTAGGTGKTPATCMIAEWAQGEGYDVAVLSRGYGGKKKERVTIVSDGKDILAGPEEAGDEPCLLAGKLPGIPVVTSKDRYLAGLAAHKNFGSSFFILDDGYQHLALKRDLNLLLLDAANPFGNGRLLPRGPLREPVNQIARADAIIFTRANFLTNGKDMGTEIKYLFQGKPVFMGDHLPVKVVFPFRGTSHDPDFLKGKRVMAFAGIARPDSFSRTLISLGAEILSFRHFPDHHPFTDYEIRTLIQEKVDKGAEFLITTEKDRMRAPDLISGDPCFSYLTIRFELSGEREGFFRMVGDKIKGSSLRQGVASS